MTLPLTADLRADLRVKIDKARREQIAWVKDDRCTGCGTELSNFTHDCKKCCDRQGHRRRQRDRKRLQPA